VKKRDRILVIDVESTCWEKPTQQDMSEIIEIGITELRREGTLWIPITTESIAVKNVYSPVSAFCTQLTGWTQDMLDDLSISYTQAMDILKRQYKSKDAIFASWGKYDDKMFQQMSKVHKVGYPFNNDHLNVKALFGALHGRVMGVTEALNFYGMEFEGMPHRGADDSYNIARLLLRILEDQ